MSLESSDENDRKASDNGNVIAATSAALDVDAAFQQVGPFGWASVYVVSIMSMMWAVAAWSFSMPVFIAASPHRKVVSCTAAGMADASSCEVGTFLSEGAGCEESPGLASPIWAYDHPQESLAAEFELVCDRRVFVALVGSVYFLGVFAGNLLLGPLPDVIGRTRALCLSISVCVPFSALDAIAPSFTVYLSGRFGLGFGMASLCNVSWIYASEIVGSSEKTKVITIMSVTWAAGMLLLVPVVLIVPDWRPLTWIHTALMGVLMAISLGAWRKGFDSPPWLASRGDVVSFHRVMAQMAWVNRATYMPQDSKEDAVGSASVAGLEETPASAGKPLECSADEQSGDVGFKAVLCTQPWACYSLVFSGCFCALSLGYYGLSLNSGHSGHDGNPYAVHVGLALSALGELPGVLIAPLLVDSQRFGRRGTLFSGMLAAGVCCLGLAALPKDAIIASQALSTVGKTFNVIGYNTIFVYSSEVYPVMVRSFALGLFSTVSRVSAMMAPVLVEMPPPLPAVFIGALMAVAATPSLLLPETLPALGPEESNAHAPTSKTATKLRGWCCLRRYAQLEEDGASAVAAKVVSDGGAAAAATLGRPTTPSDHGRAAM